MELSAEEKSFMLDIWKGRHANPPIALQMIHYHDILHHLQEENMIRIDPSQGMWVAMDFTEQGWIVAKELADEFPAKHYAKCIRCGGLINYQEWVTDPEGLLYCSEECRDGIMDDWSYL